MDKQKQIEGMAKIILEKAFENYETSGSVEIDTEVRQTCYCAFLVYCEALYNAGCRILTENAVVLTEEEFKEKIDCCDVSMIHHDDDGKRYIEYEKYKDFTDRLGKRIQQLKGQLKQERKETAEKFAERLKERLDISAIGYSTEEIIIEVEDKIDEICKEFVEVE